MKPQHLEHTGSSWEAETPAILHTAQARELFGAAISAGILREVWASDGNGLIAYVGLDRGPGMTRAQLAYWCKLASSYLGIDRGGTTNWKPFETLFGKGLKGTLHDIGYTAQAADGARQEYTRPIDKFFATLNTSTNEQ